jgi:hypothetical protein
MPQENGVATTITLRGTIRVTTAWLEKYINQTSVTAIVRFRTEIVRIRIGIVRYRAAIVRIRGCIVRNREKSCGIEEGRRVHVPDGSTGRVRPSGPCGNAGILPMGTQRGRARGGAFAVFVKRTQPLSPGCCGLMSCPIEVDTSCRRHGYKRKRQRNDEKIFPCSPKSRPQNYSDGWKSQCANWHPS